MGQRVMRYWDKKVVSVNAFFVPIYVTSKRSKLV